MEHIIDGVLRFQREVHPNSAALYRELAIFAVTPGHVYRLCGLAHRS